MRAIRYLKDLETTHGVDPTRFALLGRSVGGQIALLAAYTLNDPDISISAVVSMYGPAALRWGYYNPAKEAVIDSSGALEIYLGGPPNYPRGSVRRRGAGTLRHGIVAAYVVHPGSKGRARRRLSRRPRQQSLDCGGGPEPRGADALGHPRVRLRLQRAVWADQHLRGGTVPGICVLRRDAGRGHADRRRRRIVSANTFVAVIRSSTSHHSSG